MAAYAVAAGTALLFPHRPSHWPLIVLAHVALVAVALLAGRLRQRGGAAEIAADWYPLLVLPLLYLEIPVLNTAVWEGRFFDPVILAMEQRLFGGQPSTELAPSLPWPLLSELLHASYISYYPMIYGPPLFLYLKGRREDYRALLQPLVTAFLLHYLVFIFFPVQGPRYLFPAPGGEIAGWPFYSLAHTILEAGSSRGAAFPSSHMAVAVVQTVSAFRFLPRAAPLLLVATIGLGVGAVYGGFHYATDMVAGAMAGGLIAWLFAAYDDRGATR